MKSCGSSLISVQNNGRWHLMEAYNEPVLVAHALSLSLNLHGHLDALPIFNPYFSQRMCFGNLSHMRKFAL